MSVSKPLITQKLWRTVVTQIGHLLWDDAQLPDQCHTSASTYTYTYFTWTTWHSYPVLISTCKNLGFTLHTICWAAYTVILIATVTCQAKGNTGVDPKLGRSLFSHEHITKSEINVGKNSMSVFLLILSTNKYVHVFFMSYFSKVSNCQSWSPNILDNPLLCGMKAVPFSNLPRFHWEISWIKQTELPKFPSKPNPSTQKKFPSLSSIAFVDHPYDRTQTYRVLIKRPPSFALFASHGIRRISVEISCSTSIFLCSIDVLHSRILRKHADYA